jgi:tetratricopeptide (TPR) repeat protein
MSEHPRRDKLEGFLLSSLSVRDVKSMVGHLLGGCDQCRDGMEPLASSMFTPDAGSSIGLSAEEDAAYDRSIAAAFSKALEHERRLMNERENAADRAEEILRVVRQSENPVLPEGPISWGLCEALLEKSRELRHSNRTEMLRMANLARFAADRLDAALYGKEQRTDMQARSWAELANAWRVNEDLSQAEAAMACSLELRALGTGDPLLYARIADLDASLLCDQRRFKEAFRMLDIALAIHRRHSDPHEVGRVTVLKGLYTGYAGRTAEGLQLLAQGLSLIDRARDPKLVFHTLHNILLFRVELGEYEQAQHQLQRMRPLYAAHAAWLDMTKLHSIEGDIAAGLGDLVTAEATYQQVRQDLTDAGLNYQAALMSLDLAGIWLRQGRTVEVRNLAMELMASFRALGVEREAISALYMLQDALERDQATVDILRLVSGILRRLQNEPATRSGLEAL